MDVFGNRKLMSEKLEEALTKVVGQLQRNPKPQKTHLDDRKLHVECGQKYIRVWFSWTILVLLPNGDAFEPASANGGRLPNLNRLVGNIIELIKRPGWRRKIKFITGQYDYPFSISFGSFGSEKSECICGRTDNLKQTVLGLRCNYCRGADVRHINSVRQLGGMPRVGDNLIRNNADYYKNKLE